MAGDDGPRVVPHALVFAFSAGNLPEALFPEAFHHSPRYSGLLAAIGFGLLLLVDATMR